MVDQVISQLLDEERRRKKTHGKVVDIKAYIEKGNKKCSREIVHV